MTSPALANGLVRFAQRCPQRVRRVARTPLFVLLQAALARLPFHPLEVAWFYVLQLSPPSAPRADRRSKVAVRFATRLDLHSLVACQDKRALFLERFDTGERCVVATVDGKVVGYEWVCIADTHEEERYRYLMRIPPSAVYVYDAYIAPEYRLRGVWVFLKLHIAEFVRQLGRQTIITMIEHGNGLSMRTHLRYGYSAVRRIGHLRVLGLRLFFERELALAHGTRQDAERD